MLSRSRLRPRARLDRQNPVMGHTAQHLTARKTERSYMDTKITKDMLVGDILRAYPQSAYALMECGMGCIGCPASQGESVADAAMVHGLDGDDIVRYLNEYIEALEKGETAET